MIPCTSNPKNCASSTFEKDTTRPSLSIAQPNNLIGVGAMFGDVGVMPLQLILILLDQPSEIDFQVRARSFTFNEFESIDDKVEAGTFVVGEHAEGGGGRSFFVVAVLQ